MGRAEELDEVVQLLTRKDARRVTLTGPGGTGKTRLALQAAAEAAEDFPEGVWWTPLASLRRASLAPAAIAQALDVNEEPRRSIDKSLVRRRDGASEPRYWMLERIREYAGEVLDRCGEADARRLRHAEFFTVLGSAVDSWRRSTG